MISTFLEELDRLATRPHGKGDADGERRLCGDGQIIRLNGNLIACFADGLDAGVRIVRSQGEMAHGAFRVVLSALGEDLDEAGACIKHDAGLIALTPAALDGQPEDVPIEMDGFLEFCLAAALECRMMQSLDQ